MMVNLSCRIQLEPKVPEGEAIWHWKGQLHAGHKLTSLSGGAGAYECDIRVID